MQNKLTFKKILLNEDIITLIIFSIVSIVIIIFQSSRIFSLWDFTNYTDLAARILAGQIPYLDIPLYTQPGSFVDIALSYLVFGKNIYAIYIGIFVKQIIIGILLIKIINLLFDLNFLEKIYILIIFAFLNSWSIVPQPTYDADIVFALVFSTWVFIKLLKNVQNLKMMDFVLIAISIWLPFWYKQSTGLTWLIFGHLFLIAIGLKNKKYLLIKFILLFDFIIFISILFMNIKTSIFNEWIKWAVQKPLETRLTSNMTPLAQLNRLLDFKDLFILIIIVYLFYIVINKLRFRYSLNIGFILISTTIILLDFAYRSWNKNSYFDINFDRLIAPIIISIFVYNLLNILMGKVNNFLKFLNLGLMLSLASNYLSQGIVGSSYAFFPLYLLILILSSTSIYKVTEIKKKRSKVDKYFLSIAIAIIGLSVTFYSYSKIRMAYVRFDEPVERYPKLYGWIGMPGEYLKETQTGIDLFNEYSKRGRTTVWPGEDPVSLF